MAPKKELEDITLAESFGDIDSDESKPFEIPTKKKSQQEEKQRLNLEKLDANDIVRITLFYS
jgi:hypothetical protein